MISYTKYVTYVNGTNFLSVFHSLVLNGLKQERERKVFMLGDKHCKKSLLGSKHLDWGGRFSPILYVK